MIKLNAKQLRISNPSLEQLRHLHHFPIILVLDNIIDTFNIGSFFRLADAIAAKKIYLCGRTITPPNVKIHRASIGTWRWVPWEHKLSTLEVVKKLKGKGYQTVAAEQSRESIPYTKFKPNFPTALVVGHETIGVSKEVLAEVDKIVEIPMFGVNLSLNVLVSASIILYDWLTKTKVKFPNHPRKV